MRDIHPTRPNRYTGSPLDRVDARRDDAAWIEAQRADPASLAVPVWRGKTLFTGLPNAPAACFVPVSAVAGDAPWALLGVRDGTAYFAVDLGAADEPPALLRGQWEDLRAAGAALPAADASILAHARALMHWRSRDRFCGVCGAAVRPHHAGNHTVCTACDAHHFPRTDPAVIMLVHERDRVLLGHSARFPNSTMYSTLAGFVEPGESLEEAVRREVMEESGIDVGAVRYHSSQPWPFPASLMLGFYAEARSEKIVLADNELLDARWFTRAQLTDPAAHGFQLPRGDSIARRLIEDWMAHAEAHV